MGLRRIWSGLGILMGISSCAYAQLRVATYNISNYDGSNRANDLKTILYGSFQSRQFAPDVIVCQEFITASSLTTFVGLLNSAVGSPADWTASPFVDGADTESVCCYRTSKVDFLGYVLVSVGSSSSTNHPRNVLRYDFGLKNYTGESAKFSYYSSHMKAGSTDTDRARRFIESQRIRANAETLPAGRAILLGGDFNIQSSTETAYVHLTESTVNNFGRLFDPINRPGSWVNNGAFRFIHTQDPAGGGGVDDRFDQILLSSGLLDGEGFEYIGDDSIPFSSTTWNDPIHSYRCWGNDGTSFNLPLTTTGNQNVGPTIAQALIVVADTSGHLPVFLDLRVPPKMAVSHTEISFGKVFQSAKPVKRSFSVLNSADVALWNQAGISDLESSVSIAGAGFLFTSGSYLESPALGSNLHEVWLDTRTSGRKSATITLQSNDPDIPDRTITLTGTVIGTRGR